MTNLHCAVMILLLLTLYFLPTIIAASHRRVNVWAIFALDLFTGWTFFGWVICLVWALTVGPDGK